MTILHKKLKEMGLKDKEAVIKYIDEMTECTFDDNMMAVINIIMMPREQS